MSARSSPPDRSRVLTAARYMSDWVCAAKDDLKAALSESLRGATLAQKWIALKPSMQAKSKFNICRSQSSQDLALLPWGLPEQRPGEVDTGRYAMKIAISDADAGPALDEIEHVVRGHAMFAGMTFCASWVRGQESNHYDTLRTKLTPRSRIVLIDASGVETEGNTSSLERLQRINADLRLGGIWITENTCGILFEVLTLRIFTHVGTYSRVGLPTEMPPQMSTNALFNLEGETGISNMK